MAIADDFTVATNGDIRHVANTNHYTVLELHRFLQDLLDNPQATSGSNDFADITTSTLSDRKTDNIIELLNGANIDDDAAEYFYGGSIQNTDGTLYSGLQVLGAVSNTSTQLVVVQDNALYTYTTTPASPFWGTQATGGYNGDSANGILMRCLIKTSLAGTDIDGKRVRLQARHWGDTYDFFNVTLGSGESVAALGTTPDAQNDTSQATVTAYADVLNSGGTANAPLGGYQTIDLQNGNGAQPYYSQWTYGAQGGGLKALYEYIKDLTGNGTAKTLDSLNGEFFLGVTHEIAYDNQDTTEFFTEQETISWGSGVTAGTGLLLADTEAGVDGGLTGTMWIQLLTGVAPTDGIVLSGATCNADVNGAPVLRTVPKIFLGSYTGSLIGAFGIGVDPNDLAATDRVTDLLNVNQTPPNNQTFTVSGLVSGEDSILVGPNTGSSAFDFAQLTVLAQQTGAAVTSLQMTAAIPTDTPASGTIRVRLTNDILLKIDYSSYATDTFTITSTDFSTTNSHATNKDCMISYIDKVAGATSESFTAVYLSDRNLFVRRRDGGSASPTKTFESDAVFSATGGSSVAARITDA